MDTIDMIAILVATTIIVYLRLIAYVDKRLSRNEAFMRQHCDEIKALLAVHMQHTDTHNPDQ